MSPSSRNDLLARSATRAAAQPFFLGSALAAFQDANDVDDAALAARLGCDIDRLPLLRLCRRPEPGSERFRAEVEQIAAYAGVQAVQLALLLREVAAAQALTEAAGSHSSLLAARDAAPNDDV